MRKIGKNPLVSVIIPAYNQGPWLARAIESALRQTYPHVEVIVVNDGSPASITRETAERYAGRIVYLERGENGGVGAARNTGLEAAHGELIAWLDQDDLWLPHKLEVEVRALQAHPHVALVHSSYYLIDSQGRRTGIARLPQREWKPLPALLLAMPISPCTVLFPRHLMSETGPLDPAMNGADDWYWCLLLAARGYRFYCLHEPLAEYRLHENNTWRKADLMVPAWMTMLDRFYSLPNLPVEALRWKGRAYFQKHAWAAATYYGVGKLDEATRQLQSAARCYPGGIATGRFLQSMVYSASAQPSQATAQAAIRFVESGLQGIRLPTKVVRKLRAQARLVLAMHAEKGGRERLGYVVAALLANPQLVIDPELWAAGGRLLGRIGGRHKAGSAASR